jgi:hypothetical protein
VEMIDKVLSVEALNSYRKAYAAARIKLLRAEELFASENGGKWHPGSPLALNLSLADVAREFIVVAERPLTYIQIRSEFEKNYVPFTEGKLKKALRQAIKGPAMRRLNTRDLLKKIEDDDVFDKR